MTFGNNFKTFEEDFRKDTGLDPHSSREMYMQYVKIRLADINVQILQMIYNKLPDKKLF